jgi:hypothetical protein
MTNIVDPAAAVRRVYHFHFHRFLRLDGGKQQTSKAASRARIDGLSERYSSPSISPGSKPAIALVVKFCLGEQLNEKPHYANT